MMDKLIKQIKKVEGINSSLLKDLYFNDDGQGQYYNGVTINNNTILVLMEYTDRHTYLSEYFHYDIKNNKLIQVDSDTDDYYRELFEDCHMLDCLDSFFIMGIDENCKLLYGNKYNNNIVSL